jgi:membrane complex biogenesis BtpA family protein
MQLSRDRCALIGMIHLPALPGSSGWGGSMRAVLDHALADARALAEGGCDALLVENMGDLPFLRGRVEPETVAAAALAVQAVAALGLPTGVQLLAAANREALGVAAAAGATFVRVEAFAYAHVADEGWLDACAGDLLRARRALEVGDAPRVRVWADVKKKHAAHAVTADLSLAEAARGTAFCGADALVVTGARTGDPAAPADVDAALSAGVPVLVGSGVTAEGAAALSARAHGLIVGTWLKHDGDWRRPVDVARVRELRRAIGSR